MIFFNTIFFLTFINFLFFSFGFFLLNIIKNEKQKIISIFYGISIITIITNIFYFILNFNISKILIILIVVLLIISIINLKDKSFFNFFFSQLKHFVPMFVIGSFLAFIYNEQFFIFRGNHYDSSNYTSMSLLFSKYSYIELKDIYINQESFKNLFDNNFYFKNGFLIFSDRVLISLLTSYLYLPDLLSIFHANYIIKVFFLSCISLSLFAFFDLNNLKIKNIYFYAQAFNFSFWPIYIFEIDAHSQISSYSLSIICFSLFFLISSKLDNIKLKDLLCYTILFSTFFSLYPEQAVIFFLFFSIYFIFSNYLKIKKNFINLILSIFFFSFIILLNPNILEFLFRQISYYNQSNDWWAYFGSFILGSNNLILNESFIIEAREFISLNSFPQFLKYIVTEHIHNKFYFFYLNILPSFFGFYFISVGQIIDINLIDFLRIFIQIILNIFLISIIFKNIKFYSNLGDIKIQKYFIYFFYYLLVLFLILLFNGSFWQIIKLYFYSSFFIFILITLDLKRSKGKIIYINYIPLILLLIFPLYKFSVNNDGLNRVDSFPSSLNKELKQNYKWTELLIKNKECNKLEISEKNNTAKMIFSQYYSYYEIEHIFIDNQNKSVNCIK